STAVATCPNVSVMPYVVRTGTPRARARARSAAGAAAPPSSTARRCAGGCHGRASSAWSGVGTSERRATGRPWVGAARGAGGGQGGVEEAGGDVAVERGEDRDEGRAGRGRDQGGDRPRQVEGVGGTGEIGPAGGAGVVEDGEVGVGRGGVEGEGRGRSRRGR